MSKKLKLLSVVIALTMIVSSVFMAQPFSAANSDTAQTQAGTDYNLPTNVQDGEILHAWNISYNNIKSNLANIAAAGFSTVQTSPVQQPKDFNASWTDVSGQWWKLYQPLSFSIAEKSWLGSKQELTSLCTEAHKYGIKIICDIVVNHLANNGGSDTFNTEIAKYEPTIYNNTSAYFHPYRNCTDNSIQDVVQGNIGMPDLNTSNSYVQERVTSLLKECVDCGVDGFRFDAAKHIETPSDGSYASNFWPNVLGATTSYAQSNYSKTPYYYGEILNTCGNGRSFSSYTPYMSVVDNVTGNNIMWSINNKNASGAANSSFNTGVSGNKIVMWAESHDTYADDSTSGVSQTTINKAYCLGASRNKIAMLYFMRTDGASMGSIGSTSYKSSAVSAANNFHNQFLGYSEYLSSYSNYAMCERYSNDSTTTGMVIVNCSGTNSSVSNVTTQKMKDGTYTDTVTGNTFTVSGGKLSGTIGSTGVAVISNGTSPVTPTEETYDPSTEEGFYLVGTINGQDCWNTLTTDRKLHKSATVEGQYELDYTFHDNDEIKVVGFFDNVATFYPSYGDNYRCTTAGNKTGECTLYFNPEGNSKWSYVYLTVQKKSTEPTTEPTEPTQAPTGKIELPDGYYLVGTINGKDCWPSNITADRRLHLDSEYTKGERYVLYYTLYARDAIKVVKLENGVVTKWYKDENKTSYTINNRYDEATYKIYFMPDGYKSWIYTYINATKHNGEIPTYSDETEETTEPTALPTTEPTTEPTEAPTAPAKTYIYGDANLNGEVQIIDVTLIQKHLSHSLTLSALQQKAAHVTNTPSLSIVDATVIQRYLAHYKDGSKVGTTFTE